MTSKTPDMSAPGPGRPAGAMILWIVLPAVLSLAVGCGGTADDGGMADSSPSRTASASADPSCSTVSPNSPGQEGCQAAGIPGTTVDSDRCRDRTADPSDDGFVEGTFGSYCDNAVATTYNTALIPDDAVGTVTVTETNADTTVQLAAQGFAPDATYTARLHREACGADPADAGDEVQDPQDGQAGGSGLAVDFTTDGTGNATAEATAPWVLPGEGKSLVISGSGDAAPAGCITLRD